MELLLKNLRLPDGAELKYADIGVTGGRIAFIGNAEGKTANRVLDCRGGIAIPALVNTHTHAYMTLFRGLADDLPFSEWLFGRIMPMEDSLSAEDAYTACLLSCAEMIKNGTGCFCDMHMFPGASARAAIESGMRAVISRGLSGGGSIPGGDRRLREAEGEMDEFAGQSRLGFLAAPHAIYTCDTDYIKQIIAFAERRNLGINIHLSESKTEVADCFRLHGVSPVAYLDGLGLFEHKTLAAHCVHLSDGDIELLARRKVSVSANARSNLKLGNGIAPIGLLYDAGVNICLGTDSAASNNTLDLFAEMSMTALLHKGTSGDASLLPATKVLEFATKNGNTALSLDGGELAIGKNADIAVISADSTAMVPLALSSLCYSACGRDVDSLVVDGKILMEHRALLTLDEERIKYDAAKAAERLLNK